MPPNPMQGQINGGFVPNGAGPFAAAGQQQPQKELPPSVSLEAWNIIVERAGIPGKFPSQIQDEQMKNRLLGEAMMEQQGRHGQQPHMQQQPQQGMPGRPFPPMGMQPQPPAPGQPMQPQLTGPGQQQMRMQMQQNPAMQGQPGARPPTPSSMARLGPQQGMPPQFARPPMAGQPQMVNLSPEHIQAMNGGMMPPGMQPGNVQMMQQGMPGAGQPTQQQMQQMLAQRNLHQRLLAQQGQGFNPGPPQPGQQQQQQQQRMPTFQVQTPQQPPQGAMQGVGIAGGVRHLQSTSPNAPSPADETSPPNAKRARRSTPDKKGNAPATFLPQPPQGSVMISNQAQMTQGMRMPSNPGMPVGAPGGPTPQPGAAAPPNRGRGQARGGQEMAGTEAPAPASARGQKRKAADESGPTNNGPAGSQKQATTMTAQTPNGVKTSSHNNSPALNHASKDNKTPPAEKPTPPLVPGPGSTPSNAQPVTPKQDNVSGAFGEFINGVAQFAGTSSSLFGQSGSSPRSLSQRLNVELPLDGAEVIGGGWDQTHINVAASNADAFQFLDASGGQDDDENGYQMYFNFDQEEGANFDELTDFGVLG
ncbi:hypothetical protein CALCODRAFT_51921 [Calocera cornea HHB12733]|uniref:Uncharacterized protein n=1 Tax=Calocera cornea HHB12733 TaxID=1353952 RepID=A0A165DRR7_9BASI|nr:hypothetical protein CALCODRAFT_51921 [Calocera cornea HHB12733]